MEKELHCEWNVWYDCVKGSHNYEKTVNWQNNLSHIASIKTIDDFCRVFANLPEPSDLPYAANLYVFRHYIRPVWEDSFNVDGSELRSSIENLKPHVRNQLWQNLCASLLGEQLDDKEEIAGIVYNKRGKGDRMAIWITNKTSLEGKSIVKANCQRIGLHNINLKDRTLALNKV